MNKTKIILAAIGGVIGVAVLGAAVFAYFSFAAKTAAMEGDDENGVDGLETVTEKAEQLSRKSVFPCADSVKILTESREKIAEWKDEAFKLAARGDRPIVPMTPAQFKEFVIGEAHRVTGIKSDSTNTICAADFEFGPFKPYIAEGKMPEAEALKDLQRKFDDAVTIIEMLAAAGVSTVRQIDVKDVVQKVEEEAKPKKGARRLAKKFAKDDAPAFKPETHTYEIVCKTRPAALVKALNAFATSERFMVVDNFRFALERDAIVAAFNGNEKKDEPQTGRRRRRRSSSSADESEQQAAQAEAPKVTVVTDPAVDATFDAALTVTVHDFKSMEETKEDGEESK